MRKKLGKSLFYLSILELFFKICTSLQVFVLLGSQPSTTNGETSFHHCWFCPLYNIFLIYGECISWCSMWITLSLLFVFSFFLFQQNVVTTSILGWIILLSSFSSPSVLKNLCLWFIYCLSDCFYENNWPFSSSTFLMA